MASSARHKKSLQRKGLKVSLLTETQKMSTHKMSMSQKQKQKQKQMKNQKRKNLENKLMQCQTRK